MRSTAFLLPLALTGLPFLACSSNFDHADRNAQPEAQGRHHDFYSITDPVQLEAAVRAQCVGACTPDPGSKPVNVSLSEAGYQFAWLWDLVPDAPHENKAWATFTYDDNTTDFVLPVRTPSTTGYGWGGWEPKGDPVPTNWQGPPYAVRFKGGPFTEYGGGLGVSLRTISNGIGPGVSVQRTDPGIVLLEQTPSVEFPDPSAGAYDLTSYEGVAIWVRRGPDGQSTMRLGITERNSAEDLNSSAIRDATSTAPAVDDPADNHPPGIFEGKYCKRWRICGCSGGTPCTQVPGMPDQFRCYDPSFETPSVGDLLGLQLKYPHCGTSRCKDKNSSTITPDPDPLFFDRSCSEAVTPDGHSDMFCYDPGKDPTPPAKRERCNNPFSRPITVTTDWQLIKVPFADLRQADEAQVAGDMDLKSVKQFVVTYGGGWIDFWIANVGFYRKQ